LWGDRSQGNHTATRTKSFAADFGAVVEKKLSLLEKKADIPALELKRAELELHLKSDPKDKSALAELKDIEKKLKKGPHEKEIDQTLAKAPTHDEMESLNAKISKRLGGTNEGKVSIAEAQKELRYKNKTFQKKPLNPDPEIRKLGWGASHINESLTAPSNWTNIRKASIKTSKSGDMHVFVNEILPQNIGEEGGVPAGLRGVSPYVTRPANLMVSKSYMVEGGKTDADPANHVGVQVSFRGGQFPTKEAAKTALLTIIRELPPGQKLEEFHVSALLTPTLKVIKKDKQLLATHKENVMAAIDELIKEVNDYKPGPELNTPKNLSDIPNAKVPSRDSLENLKKNVAISNFGVNEGAGGGMKILGIPLRLGWHTSIEKYSNDAGQKLNASLGRKFETVDGLVKNFDPQKTVNDGLVEELDNLGAMTQVGLELEKSWAENSFADGRVGNNQFKVPALWKVMDTVLGVVSYVNCMSGKDRTGKVEGNANDLHNEIMMNKAEHKKNLSEKFETLGKGLDSEKKAAWDSQKAVLTSACFNDDDLATLQESLKRNGVEVFQSHLKELVEKKVTVAKTTLGIAEGGPMKEKTISMSAAAGTVGISNNVPLMNQSSVMTLLHSLPKLVGTSIFGRENVNLAILTPDEMGAHFEKIKEVQRESGNKENGASLDITQMNTGTAGFKVEGGEPFDIYSSGFDREFVLCKLLDAGGDIDKLSSDLAEWLGLDDFDDQTANEFKTKIQEISTSNLSDTD
jgi:hypothetical protein